MEIVEISGTSWEQIEHFDRFRDQTKDAARELEAFAVVVFKRFFPEKLIREARELCLELGRNATQDHDIEVGCPNYHRVDDGSTNPKIKLARCLHRYFFLPWNFQQSSAIDRIAGVAIQVRNALMGFEQGLFLSKEHPTHYVHWPVLQYPRGGGFLAAHTDSRDAVYVEGGVTLSRLGEDFSAGGFWIRGEDGAKCLVEERLELGDLLMFRQDQEHGVDPIDPEAEIDWGGTGGRWSMVTSARVTPEEWGNNYLSRQ